MTDDVEVFIGKRFTEVYFKYDKRAASKSNPLVYIETTGKKAKFGFDFITTGFNSCHELTLTEPAFDFIYEMFKSYGINDKDINIADSRTWCNIEKAFPFDVIKSISDEFIELIKIPGMLVNYYDKRQEVLDYEDLHAKKSVRM